METAVIGQPFGLIGVGEASGTLAAGGFAAGPLVGAPPGSVTPFAVSAPGVGATIGWSPGIVSVRIPLRSAGTVRRTWSSLVSPRFTTISLSFVTPGSIICLMMRPPLFLYT